MNASVKVTVVVAVILAVTIASFLLFRSSTVQVPVTYYDITPGTNVLTVYSGDCLSPWHIDVDESDNSVRVTVAVDRHNYDECPDILESREIVLAEPLGERVVIDGSQNTIVEIRPDTG